MTGAPVTVAERFTHLDTARSLRLAGEKGADGTLRVVLSIVRADRRELLFSFPPNRLRTLARELESQKVGMFQGRGVQTAERVDFSVYGIGQKGPTWNPYHPEARR